MRSLAPFRLAGESFGHDLGRERIVLEQPARRKACVIPRARSCRLESHRPSSRNAAKPRRGRALPGPRSRRGAPGTPGAARPGNAPRVRCTSQRFPRTRPGGRLVPEVRERRERARRAPRRRASTRRRPRARGSTAAETSEPSGAGYAVRRLSASEWSRRPRLSGFAFSTEGVRAKASKGVPARCPDRKCPTESVRHLVLLVFDDFLGHAGGDVFTRIYGDFSLSKPSAPCQRRRSSGKLARRPRAALLTTWAMR